MNPEQQIARLEGLLARIKHNASLPRAVVVAAPAAPAPLADLDEPDDFEDLAPTPPPPAPPVAMAPALDRLDELDELGAAEPLPDDLDEAEDLDLIEDDIIDITDLDDAEAAAIEAEAAMLEAGEEPPSSSPRPKAAAASMDEALASAAAQLDDDEREIPLQTPPPESGDQVAAVPLASAQLRQKRPADDLLEVDDELPQRDLDAGPTPEQLGETIDLDEPLGPALELDTPKARPPAPEPPSALEEPIVSAAAGAFHEDLELPPEAAADLARHREREGGVAPVAVPPRVPAAAATGSPQVVQRPAVAAIPQAFAGAPGSSQPPSFAELLDESLSL